MATEEGIFELEMEKVAEVEISTNEVTSDNCVCGSVLETDNEGCPSVSRYK